MATKAVVKVFTPDRVLYDSVSVPILLSSGREIQWYWNKDSLPEHLGLWVIDYALFDNNNNIIQKYTRGAIFSQRIDVPIGNYNLGDFQMWAASNGEEFTDGEEMHFYIHLKNNTDSVFNGKIMVVKHHRIIDSIMNVELPANTETVYEYDYIFDGTARFIFGLYAVEDTNYNASWLQDAIVKCEKGVWRDPRPFQVSLSLDKYTYQIGRDTVVHYTENIKNNLGHSCLIRAELWTLFDSTMHLIRSDTFEILPNRDTIIAGNFYPFDYDSGACGNARLEAKVIYKDSVRAREIVPYNLIYPTVQCSVSLPDTFDYNGQKPYTVPCIQKEIICHLSNSL